MLKIPVQYDDYVDGDDKVIEDVIRFAFTLNTVRMYEQRTDRLFYDDLQHAVEEVASFYDRLDGRDYDELTEAEQVAMLPMMTNPVINTFMLEVMPVLYAETNGVSLVQSDATSEKKNESLWLIELVNAQSFFDIFEELSKHNAVKTKVKKPRKSSKQ